MEPTRTETLATAPTRVSVEVRLPPGGPLSGMAADVRAGLTRPFKELSPRYFYDERGSQLFERITQLPEYYPTRCERAILETRSDEIVAAAEPCTLIELGSGSAAKTRVLLDAMCAAGCLEAFCPVDISEEITCEASARIADEYDGIDVHGLVCDFELDLERMPVGGPRMIALLGGTIGNFQPQQRAGFLRRICNLLAPEVDIRLRSLVKQVVEVASLDLTVGFERDEDMRTEISTKFARQGLEGIYAEAGLEMCDWWTDPDGLFGLSLARVRS